MTYSTHEIIVDLGQEQDVRDIFAESNAMNSISETPAQAGIPGQMADKTKITFRTDGGLKPHHVERLEKVGAQFVPGGA